MSLPSLNSPGFLSISRTTSISRSSATKVSSTWFSPRYCCGGVELDLLVERQLLPRPPDVPRSMSAFLKRKPSWPNASRIACCAGSGCTLIGSRSPESTARAISSSVVTPMFIPGRCVPRIVVIGVSHGISSPNGTACTAPGLHLERTTEPLLGELDVLLVLLVAALDLDPGLQSDGQPLDLLVHGPALDPHLALYDPARDDVLLGAAPSPPKHHRHPGSRAAS